MTEQNWKRIFADTMRQQGSRAAAVADDEADFQWAHIPGGDEPDPEEHAIRIARTYQ
jgi:hypothetical protein